MTKRRIICMFSLLALISLTACQTAPFVSPSYQRMQILEAASAVATTPAGDFQIAAQRGKKASPRPSPSPSSTIRPTPTASAIGEDLSIEVAGWYNDGWDDESHAVYTRFNKVFSEVNPYWYNLGSSDGGTQAALTDGSIYERSYVYNASKVQEVHSSNDLVIPTIGDNATGQINKILANSTSRQALISHLVQTAVSRNYNGFDLNFELGQPTGQAAFALFVDDLAKQLHRVGKRLSVTLKAADSTAAEAYEIFDYQRLGQTATDRFKVMMYDHNFDAGANVPGPIADYHWMLASLKYMIGRGLPASKIQLGLHNYAWIWKQGRNGKFKLQTPFSTWSVLQNQPLKWNSTALESWADYQLNGTHYQAYIGNARTVARRLELVKTFGLAGVVFWTLGREDQQIYSNLFQVFPAS